MVESEGTLDLGAPEGPEMATVDTVARRAVTWTERRRGEGERERIKRCYFIMQ